MTKQERLHYMRTHWSPNNKKPQDLPSDVIIPPSIEDVQDEASQLDTLSAHLSQDNHSTINSDEK